MGCFNIGNHAERSELKDFLLIKSTKKEGKANKLGDFFFLSQSWEEMVFRFLFFR